MSEELELKHAWLVIRNRKLIVIAFAIAFILIGTVFTYYSEAEVKYSATTTLLPLTKGETIRISHWEIRASRDMAETYGALVKSRFVLESAIESLGLDYGFSYLRSNTAVNYFDDTELFEIAVTDEEPAIAINLANEIAKKLIYSVEDVFFKTEELAIVDVATVAFPVSTTGRYNRNVFFALMFGIFIGIGFTFLIEYMDDSIKTTRDVKKCINLPVLGEIPVAKPGTQSFPCTDPLTDAYRLLINNIQFCNIGRECTQDCKTILITPSNPKGDKFTIAANVAIMFSKGGSSVLLVDASYNKPSLHVLFGVSNEKGFLNITAEGEELPLEEIVHKTQINNLFVLPSGRGKNKDKPAKPLTELKFNKAIDRLKEHFDFIIFHTPQLVSYTDVAVTASLVDSTVIVLDYAQTCSEEAINAKELLERARANLIGVVLNNVPCNKEKPEMVIFNKNVNKDKNLLE